MARERGRAAQTPDRPDTYEWNSRVEVFLPGYNEHYRVEVDLGYGKDVSIHHGNYLDVQTKLKINEFYLPVVQTRVEANLYGTIGLGDVAHNQYFYGSQADTSGFNNYAYGFWFAFPDAADRYYPIVQLIHFAVIGDGNRAAAFANGRSDGWLLSFIATGGVLE